MSKIIQISVIQATESEPYDIVGLGSDGVVYYLDKSAKWEKLANGLESKLDDEKVVLEPHIQELDLSTRIKNCFRQEGIETVEELLSYSMSELSMIPNLGKRSLAQIKIFLSTPH